MREEMEDPAEDREVVGSGGGYPFEVWCGWSGSGVPVGEEGCGVPQFRASSIWGGQSWREGFLEEATTCRSQKGTDQEGHIEGLEEREAPVFCVGGLAVIPEC